MRKEVDLFLRHRPLWHTALAFFACLAVVNWALYMWEPDTRRFSIDVDRRLPHSPILLANGDLRLSGWLNPSGDADQPPTLLASYRRLLERARGDAEEDLPRIGVATVVDPRTWASDCIRLAQRRKDCVAEALEYFQTLQGLLDAPLHLGIPIPMAPERSPRSEVVTSHHSISCWPGQERGDAAAGVDGITAGGGRCVLLLDALDLHAFPSYSNRVLEWFVTQGMDTWDGEGLDSLEAEISDSAGRSVLQIIGRHFFYLTTMDGRWGDFNDVLTEKEVKEIEDTCLAWLVENALAVEPEDIFFVFIMYSEDNVRVWKQKIEAMVLSLQKNGGRLKKASGALLVYTPHGEKPPNLNILAPLLETNNIEIVFMPTPWGEDMSDVWTLHFLKTDVASYAPAWERSIVMFLDLDMLILGDLVPYISPRHLRMTPATTVPEVTKDAWRRHGMQSEGERTMHHFGQMEPAYYNSGVMIAPAKILAALLVQTEREAEIELDAGVLDWLGRDQVMFEFAHYALDPPFLELPHDVNLDSALSQNLACQVLSNPIIYHYHRNPLLDGIPPIPPRACPAYSKLHQSLSTFKLYYQSEKVLGATA